MIRSGWMNQCYFSVLRVRPLSGKGDIYLVLFGIQGFHIHFPLILKITQWGRCYSHFRDKLTEAQWGWWLAPGYRANDGPMGLGLLMKFLISMAASSRRHLEIGKGSISGCTASFGVLLPHQPSLQPLCLLLILHGWGQRRGLGFSTCSPACFRTILNCLTSLGLSFLSAKWMPYLVAQ